MADVSIDSSIEPDATARAPRSVVFTSATVGYWFYSEATTFDLSYRKTSDGGATWGAPVVVAASVDAFLWDVWWDQWTPGDSGTLIHIFHLNTTNNDVNWVSLDTSSDTLGTEVLVAALTSAVSTVGVFVSGTKTRSGYLYCAYQIDAGAEKGLVRSTDNGATWSASLDATFMEATVDRALLLPASNTGDNNDCWAIYHDASTNALTLKMWDSSAGSATESATIMTLVEGATNGTSQVGFSGSIRHSDGHLIVAGVSERDAATSDHLVYDINGTGSITALTAITTDIDDHYHPAVFIDQNTNDIYVAYNGKRDGSETLDTSTKVYYTKSTDDGTSWSAGDTAYMEGAAAAVAQVWAPLSGSLFYVGWRVGTTLVGNAVNSVSTVSTTVILNSDGAATATATVASKASAALSSDGAATATITAGNADTNTVILNSSGESTATAASASIASAALSSDGAATAEVVSNSFLVPLTSDGVATAEAVGASIAAAAASSDGVATADTISSFTLNPGIIISCRISKWSTAGEVGATGLTPYLKFNNPTTRKSMDFGDSALTFKNNGDCISITAAMSPVDATNYPGLYYYSVDGTGLGTSAATRFDYYIDATISATETYMNEGSVIILDGVEVLPGLTAAEHTLLARISATLTNKHILNPSDGTISVYDDNGALLYSGLAYSNAAGTVLYNGSAAVHNTSRLA